jgi:hypothetical protein
MKNFKENIDVYILRLRIKAKVQMICFMDKM